MEGSPKDIKQRWTLSTRWRCGICRHSWGSWGDTTPANRGNIAVPDCSINKPSLLAPARKCMENFKFRHIWVCTLALPPLIHITRGSGSEFQQVCRKPGWGTWTNFRKPRKADKPLSEDLISYSRALSTRLECKHKNLVLKGHTLV